MPLIVEFSLLAPERRQIHEVPAGTDVGVWLRDNRGDTQYQIILNGQEVDSAVVNDGDIAGVCLLIGIPAIGAFLASVNWAQVIAGLVVNLIADALFKPKAPKIVSVDAPSPVYSIGAAQNSARLGAVIPVVYGRVIAIPDYAAQPYTEYVANEQYLHAILSLGQGEFDIHNTFIGETNISGLQAGVVTSQVFPPAAHASTFGVIETATGVAENVFTNREVGDQELLPTQTIGGFDMCNPDQTGTEAALDFVFAGGLYAQNTSTGALLATSVQITMTFTPINSTGTPTGAPIVQTNTFTASSNTPQRYTLKYTLPAARYRCEVVRNTAAGPSSTADRCTWAGLKFKLVTTATTVYGNVTLMAIKIKATNGVSSGSTSRVKVELTRKLAPLGVGAVAATVNPADAFVDILTASYGAGRPNTTDEIDTAVLSAARTKWSSHNGFNAVFDRATTVYEALRSSLQTVAAAPLPIGSRLSVVHDCVKPTRTALFTDSNIIEGSLTVNYAFDKDGDPEGVRIEYRDPITFEPDFVTLPVLSDDTAAINLFGCTSETVATQYANLYQNRQLLQRASINFETELEGLTVRHGDRIAVAHGTPRWGQQTEVVTVAANTLICADFLAWGTAPSYTILARAADGVPYLITGVVRGAADNEIVLPGAVPFSITGAGEGQMPTLLAFGESTTLVTDWIVTSMEPGDAFRVKISAVNYNPDVYINAMPHQLVP